MTRLLRLTEVRVAEEDVADVLAVYRSGWLTMGPRTQAFEEAFATSVGAEHAAAVSSGTAALHLALLGVGVAAGDEVVVPALGFAAAEWAVRACGATPVPCDARGVEDHRADVADVADRLSARTRAIVVTHRWGYPCDVAALEQLAAAHGVALVDDASDAVLALRGDGSGRRTGTAGEAGCFSFASDRQLCLGEGGMVIGGAALIAGVRSLRSHAMTSGTWDRHRGRAESYDVLDVGFNYRLDEPRAALGLTRLRRLPGDLDRRRAMVRAYREALAGVPGVTVPWSDADVARSSHRAFGVMLAEGRWVGAVRDELADAGIEAGVVDLPGILRLGDVPVSADVAERLLVLPLASTYGAPEVARVVGALRRAVERCSR